MENNSKSKNKVALIVVAVVVAILVLLVVVTGIAGMNKDSSGHKSEENTQASTETVASKVKKAIDGMSEDSRDEMLVDNSGNGGELVKVEDTSRNAVNVVITTTFSDLDESKDIATKIFVSICKDVPDLNSLYITSQGSGSKGLAVYRSDFPICKQ